MAQRRCEREVFEGRWEKADYTRDDMRALEKMFTGGVLTDRTTSRETRVPDRGTSALAKQFGRGDMLL